jgi:hypothetical protein
MKGKHALKKGVDRSSALKTKLDMLKETVKKYEADVMNYGLEESMQASVDYRMAAIADHQRSRIRVPLETIEVERYQNPIQTDTASKSNGRTHVEVKANKDQASEHEARTKISAENGPKYSRKAPLASRRYSPQYVQDAGVVDYFNNNPNDIGLIRANRELDYEESIIGRFVGVFGRVKDAIVSRYNGARKDPDASSKTFKFVFDDVPQGAKVYHIESERGAHDFRHSILGMIDYFRPLFSHDSDRIARIETNGKYTKVYVFS